MEHTTGSDRSSSPHDGLLVRLLWELDGLPPPALVDGAFDILAAPLDLRFLRLYLVDYGGTSLRPVATEKAPTPPSEGLSVRGTIAGRAFVDHRVIENTHEDGSVLWVPVSHRSESLGVIALGVRGADGGTEAVAAGVGLVVGVSIVGARRQSDTFEIARGAHQLELAAAMQWDLLPMPTYQDGVLEIAGGIEPAYDIAGDAFDYAANGSTLEAAILDGMGHGLGSTIMTTLAVGAYRRARRRGLPIAEVAGEMDRTIADRYEGDAFVTGHLFRTNVETGVVSWVNAGHPPPLLVRDRTCHELTDATPVLPFGLGSQIEGAVELALQPGDTLFVYSDGVIEARLDGGEAFRLDRLVDLLERNTDPEAGLAVGIRRVLDLVKEHSGERLRDDATLMGLRWSSLPR